jgi:hypothetical protein
MTKATTSVAPQNTPVMSNITNTEDRRNLAEMGRSLRRLKRKMLLEAVKDKPEPVDHFRSMILSIAMDADNQSFSSLGSASFSSLITIHED